MNSIFENRAEKWRKRVGDCIKSSYGTQAAFAKAFNERYRLTQNGQKKPKKVSQKDVSRWCRAGTEQELKGKKSTIGFPTYQTMHEIADILGVSLGYLLGETDYETFEMQRTCEFLGIDRDTGNAIKGITDGERVEAFGHYEKEYYRMVLQRILTSDFFAPLVKQFDEYGQRLYRRTQTGDAFRRAEQRIGSKELFMWALEHWDDLPYSADEESDFTQSQIYAIQEARRAIEEAEAEEGNTEMLAKLAKYEVLEVFAKLTEDVVANDALPLFARPVASISAARLMGRCSSKE